MEMLTVVDRSATLNLWRTACVVRFAVASVRCGTVCHTGCMRSARRLRSSDARIDARAAVAVALKAGGTCALGLSRPDMGAGGISAATGVKRQFTRIDWVALPRGVENIARSADTLVLSRPGTDTRLQRLRAQRVGTVVMARIDRLALLSGCCGIEIAKSSVAHALWLAVDFLTKSVLIASCAGIF